MCWLASTSLLPYGTVQGLSFPVRCGSHARCLSPCCCSRHPGPTPLICDPTLGLGARTRTTLRGRLGPSGVRRVHTTCALIRARRHSGDTRGAHGPRTLAPKTSFRYRLARSAAHPFYDVACADHPTGWGSYKGRPPRKRAPESEHLEDLAPSVSGRPLVLATTGTSLPYRLAVTSESPF